MSGAKKEDVKATIESVVRDIIRSGNIVNIVVERGLDSDGDDIIMVKVIFDNKNKYLDARETSRVTSSVRKRLIEMDERRFPLFSYILKSEAGRLAAA